MGTHLHGLHFFFFFRTQSGLIKILNCHPEIRPSVRSQNNVIFFLIGICNNIWRDENCLPEYPEKKKKKNFLENCLPKKKKKSIEEKRKRKYLTQLFALTIDTKSHKSMNPIPFYLGNSYPILTSHLPVQLSLPAFITRFLQSQPIFIKRVYSHYTFGSGPYLITRIRPKNILLSSVASLHEISG